MIHGDLSAYNILYWEGKVTLIDFPQVTNPQTNRNAYQILRRDIERVCEYFDKWEVRSNPRDITDKLWDKYVKPKLLDMEFEEDFDDEEA
jgi:RIO kinase 1